jgi:hypothetical protein
MTTESSRSRSQQSRTPNLDELRRAAANLQALLQFPEPGMAGWHMLLGESLKAIAAFAPSESAQRNAVPQAGSSYTPQGDHRTETETGATPAVAAPSRGDKPQETPRTDRLIHENSTLTFREHSWTRLEEHARQIERELTAAQATLKELDVLGEQALKALPSLTPSHGGQRNADVPVDGSESAEHTARMLPCPSCEETDVDATYSLGQKPNGERYVNAGCMVCGTMGPDSHSMQDAVDRWNAMPRRSSLSATARRDIIEECWQALDAMIVRGELPGNGTDKSAQRNGLILACNKLFELGAYGRSKELEQMEADIHAAESRSKE